MREIIQDPHPILKKPSEDVVTIDDNVRDIASELLYYVSQPGCVGLSAIQLGVRLRVIAVKRNLEPLIIINPIIRKVSRQVYMNTEGCMSIDHGKVAYTVKRHKWVTVAGLNIYGKYVKYKGHGFFGAILQHEIDHLYGKMINDDKWQGG